MSEAETKTLNRERCLALAAVAQKALQVTQTGRGCANYDVERIADSIQGLANSVINERAISCASGGLHVERDQMAPEGVAVHVKLFDERRFFELEKLVSFEEPAEPDSHAALVAAAEAAVKVIYRATPMVDGDDEAVSKVVRDLADDMDAVRSQLTAAIAAAKE